MINKYIGQALEVISRPSTFALNGVYNCKYEQHPIRAFAWCSLALLTFPLLSLKEKSDELLSEYEAEFFLKKNEHLPKVICPQEYAHISKENGEYYVWPYCLMTEEDYEGVFDSEQEARGFLECQGYREVVVYEEVDGKREYFLSTYWVKAGLIK